jgi:hypothetical protein
MIDGSLPRGGFPSQRGYGSRRARRVDGPRRRLDRVVLVPRRPVIPDPVATPVRLAQAVWVMSRGPIDLSAVCRRPEPCGTSSSRSQITRLICWAFRASALTTWSSAASTWQDSQRGATRFADEASSRRRGRRARRARRWCQRPVAAGLLMAPSCLTRERSASISFAGLPNGTPRRIRESVRSRARGSAACR